MIPNNIYESRMSEAGEMAMAQLIQKSVNYDGGPSLITIVKRLIEAKAIIHQYEQLGFDVPTSMTEAVEALTRQARTIYRAELEASLAAAKKKAEELKSREIQREETEKEIERLKALLG